MRLADLAPVKLLLPAIPLVAVAIVSVPSSPPPAKPVVIEQRVELLQTKPERAPKPAPPA